MGSIQERFLQRLKTDFKSLAKMSGVSYDVFRERDGKLSLRGKCFWYLLTGDQSFVPQQSEKSTLLDMQSQLILREELLQLLIQNGVHSPLIGDMKAVPDQADVVKVMNQVAGWNIHYLLCNVSYRDILEGGVFTQEDLEETSKMLQELNKRLYLAAHQSPVERHRILKMLGNGIAALEMNIDSLGAENPFLASKDIRFEVVEELLKKNEK